MRGTKNERKQSVNPTQNDGDEVGDGGKGVRRGRPLAKTVGRPCPLQPVEVRL